jgi:hypothetical protein
LDPNGNPIQIHDFNPGIDEHGVFWTTRLPHHAVDVDLDRARAEMAVDHLDVADYFTFANALADGPSAPALASFELRWRGVVDRVTVRDPVNRFAGRYILDAAAVRWSARERGFRYTSDPASTSTSEFALIGQERNGVFFPA